MNLIVLYGPPASGKLTVAQELSKLTGYKIFHNHLTMDLARELYPDFNELRFNLVSKLRLEVIKYASELGTDLIFTCVYVGDLEDEAYMEKVVKIVEEHGGDVRLVELTAPDATLLERVGSESRKRFHKLKDAEVLRVQLEDGRYQVSMPYPDILKLDTSMRPASESARLIADHFQLGVS
ncbi:AAA family ATPase [Candidatus Saccharibacteria bacterium]|nr:AAA family ATPase [Candidatus Saccharibacteria bacterium]